MRNRCCWRVTLIAHFGGYAPQELDGFLQFAKNLHASHIYEAIREAEPIGEPTVARFPASVRRRYEKLARFPEGFLVLGDGISSFNPIYGQGMSSAALQAVELGREIDRGPANLARRFFTQASKVVETPWSIAVGNDLRMPEAVGRRRLSIDLANWYIAKLHRAAHRDPMCSAAFLDVTNLVAAPARMFHPSLMMRVLLGNLRGQGP